MNTLQEKLNFLLDKYTVGKAAFLSSDNQSVKIGDKVYSLLPWRNERRFIELKKIVDTTVGNISHFKIMSLNPKSIKLDYIIKRELDTAEFISGLFITEIFEAKNGNTCSVICMTNSGAVFTLELDATLKEDSEIIDKHEIITDRGTACDRGVDSQTPLSSLYVYGDVQKKYTDVDFELYGLSAYEVSVVRQAFDIAKNEKLGEENNKTDARLDILLAKAAESEKSCTNILI